MKANKELRTSDLKKIYPYIVAHCKAMGSYDYYLEQELWTAWAAKLPTDTWAVHGEGQKPFRMATTINPNLKPDYDVILKNLGLEQPK